MARDVGGALPSDIAFALLFFIGLAAFGVVARLIVSMKKQLFDPEKGLEHRLTSLIESKNLEAQSHMARQSEYQGRRIQEHVDWTRAAHDALAQSLREELTKNIFPRLAENTGRLEEKRKKLAEHDIRITRMEDGLAVAVRDLSRRIDELTSAIRGGSDQTSLLRRQMDVVIFQLGKIPGLKRSVPDDDDSGFHS